MNPSYFPMAAGTASGTTATLSLGIMNDGVAEAAEQFRLDLTSATPGVTVLNSHTVTIAASGAGFSMARQSETAVTTSTSRPVPKSSEMGQWILEPVATISPKTIPWTKVP